MEELTVIPKEQTEIQVIANNINDGLKAFEEKKSELSKLKKDAAGLTIESIEDKESIKKVATWRKTLKAARVEIQKQGKAMRDPLTKISKSISAKEDELIDIISPTEKDLQEKEDWVESEKKKLAEAEEAKKQAIIQQRIDKLAAFGFAIDIIFLQGLDEAQFEKVLGNAQAEFEKEEVKKAEDARLEEEKKAQIAKDLADLAELRRKQAEADRIIKENEERIEKDRIQKEKYEKQEAERLEFERQKEEKAKLKVIKDAAFEVRKTQLIEMGFIFLNPDFSLKDTWSCYWEQVYNPNDEEWESYIESINDAIERRKKRLESEEKQKAIDLENARLKGIADEKERERLAEIKKQQDLDAAGDKTKYNDTIAYLLKTPVHEMRSGTYRAKMKIIRDFLDGLK